MKNNVKVDYKNLPSATERTVSVQERAHFERNGLNESVKHQDPCGYRHLSDESKVMVTLMVVVLLSGSSKSGKSRKTIGRKSLKAAINRIILMTARPKIIKGKLGFDYNEPDLDFLTKSEAIHAALLLNTGGFFTPVFTGLTAMGTMCVTLDTSIGNMKLGVIGAEGAKVAAKNALAINNINALNYVNNLARNNQTFAIEIITGAKMEVIVPGAINKQDFGVKKTFAAGEVKMTCLAAKKEKGKRVTAVYQYQMSTTVGEPKIPVDIASISKSSMIVTDIPPNVKTWFRKRVTTSKGGTTDWTVWFPITL